MLHRTIFIGLGSTGCNTIDALQDIAYLTTGDAEMGGAWAYLKLDTALPGDKTFCGDTGHKIHIQVGQPEIDTLIAHMKNQDIKGGVARDDLSWLWKDGRLRVVAQTAGSGLSRRYARACLYYFWNVEQNANKSIKLWLQQMKTSFMSAVGDRSQQGVQDRLTAILPHGTKVPEVSGHDVRFVIVTALAGGTGSGALLELANSMTNDNITNDRILCLSYPPSIDHPGPNEANANNRRYNAVETLRYYESYLQDGQANKLLQPHFIISPSNDKYTLAADDSQAMRQLEYMGAMFLSRISAALDFDAMAIDLINTHPEPYPWSFALTGVRIPALEIKAQEIYKAVDRVCNVQNAADPINWFSTPVIHEQTISAQARELIKACFNKIYSDVENRFSSVISIRKKDFEQAFTDNRYDWLGSEENILKEVMATIVNEVRSFMRDHQEIQSLHYVTNLLQRIKLFLKDVPALNDASLYRAYKMLRDDPPGHTGRNRLFAWYLMGVVEQAINVIEGKLDVFKEALKDARINPESIDMIKQRQNANFYRNVVPDSFKIQIPRFSFLELDSVNNLFNNLNERINAAQLKQDILRKILRVAQIPTNTRFDKTQFSNDEARNAMRDKIEWPMLNLTNHSETINIYNACFGGALTELLGNKNQAQRSEFDQSISDLNLHVEDGRLDPNLTRIMSPYQLDALKIWKNCRVDTLKINQPEFRTGISSSANSETHGDYYRLEGSDKQALALQVLKRLLICTDNERKSDSQVTFIYELSHYHPTVWSGEGYGLILRYNSASSQTIMFPADGSLTQLLRSIMDLCNTENGESFLNNWVKFINNKKLTDTKYQERWEKLFGQGNLNLQLPDGRPMLIYSSQMP